MSHSSAYVCSNRYFETFQLACVELRVDLTDFRRDSGNVSLENALAVMHKCVISLTVRVFEG